MAKAASKARNAMSRKNSRPISEMTVGELDAMAADIENWKPGNGPQGDEWATVNLDWNGDGYVDEADAEAKAAGEPEAELYLP